MVISMYGRKINFDLFPSNVIFSGFAFFRKSLEKNLKLDYWARQVATHLRMFDECQTGLKMPLRTGRSSSKSQQIATEEVFELGKVAGFVSGPQLTLLQLISASKSRRHSQSITPLRVSAK